MQLDFDVIEDMRAHIQTTFYKLNTTTISTKANNSALNLDKKLLANKQPEVAMNH